MRGRMMLYIDQYGNRYVAATVADLKRQVGPGRVSRVYVDGRDGHTYHVGYRIGSTWLTAYNMVRNRVA